MKALMMSCKEIVKTISTEDRPNWRRRIEIRFHLMMCHHCGKYAKQLELLNKAFKRLLNSKSEQVSSEEITQVEDRIIKTIKK